MKKALSFQKTSRVREIPLSLFAANSYLEAFDFAGLINRSVTWDRQRSKVSPGQLAKSIVLSTFHGGRAPLLGIERQLAAMDVEYLFGNGHTAADFSDDSLARMLDKVALANPETIFSTLSLSCLTQFQIPIRRLHADTTSISLQGDYSACEEEGYKGLSICRGYSKDNRPDCKQVIVGKVVSEQGIPVSSMVLDGNTSDVEFNRLALSTLAQTFGERMQRMVYIADSKLVNGPTIRILCERKDSDNRPAPIRFISRAPDSFAGKVVSRLKRQAYAQNQWENQGSFGQGKSSAVYQTQTCWETVDGQELRFVVVKTSAGTERLERILQNERLQLQDAIRDLEAIRFSCEPDAHGALSRFTKAHRRIHHRIEWDIEQRTEEKRGRGNPGKNPKPPEIWHTWHVRGRIVGLDEQQVAELQQKEESFVLISNVPESQLGDRELLREYKEQHVVEVQFRMLKQPAIANAIFLKTPARIAALMMLLSVALLIRGLIQYQIRHRLAGIPTAPRIGVNRTALKNPTAEYMIQELKDVRLIRTDNHQFTCNYLTDRDLYRLTAWMDLLDLNMG